MICQMRSSNEKKALLSGNHTINNLEHSEAFRVTA
jgi:hypothetical protein